MLLHYMYIHVNNILITLLRSYTIFIEIVIYNRINIYLFSSILERGIEI